MVRLDRTIQKRLQSLEKPFYQSVETAKIRTLKKVEGLPRQIIHNDISISVIPAKAGIHLQF
jgi:hypothetical protein